MISKFSPQAEELRFPVIYIYNANDCIVQDRKGDNAAWLINLEIRSKGLPEDSRITTTTTKDNGNFNALGMTAVSPVIKVYDAEARCQLDPETTWRKENCQVYPVGGD